MPNRRVTFGQLGKPHSQKVGSFQHGGPRSRSGAGPWLAGGADEIDVCEVG